ncbi:hypothetical protein EV361DRAFT_954470 [Lentinula raphanica]|nr:hypothetical protein EV361DRAFT_954470 [Lentinula raphanica]
MDTLFIDFLRRIEDGLRLAQDTWNGEVERRAEFISMARVSTEEDRSSFAQLASETRNLLDHVNSFILFFRNDVKALDTDVPFAKRIPRNAESLQRIILQMHKIHAQVKEDPLLQQTYMIQIGAAYSARAFQPRPNPQADDIQLLALPKRQEMRRALTASLELKCFLESIPLAQAFLTHTVTCEDALKPSIVAVQSSKTVSQHTEDSRIEQTSIDFDGYVPSPSCDNSSEDLMPNFLSDDEQISVDLEQLVRDLCCDTPSEDLKSNFLNVKDQKLQMIHMVIDQFRADGEIVASQLKKAHENLRALRENHGNRLDCLDNLSENTIDRVNKYLDILRTKPTGEADTSNSLQFGQAQTTDYIEDLWTMALRLIPLQGSTSPDNMKTKVLDELRRFGEFLDRFFYSCRTDIGKDDSTSLKYKDLSMHSGFMSRIGFDCSELQAEELAFADESHPPIYEDNELVSVDIPWNEASILQANVHHESTPELCESIKANNKLACLGEEDTSIHNDELISVQSHILTEEASISPASIHHGSTPELRKSIIAVSDEKTLPWQESVITQVDQMPSKWRQEKRFTVREAPSIDYMALSSDAHYLAVAYGICVNIWDIKNTTNTAPLAHYKPDSQIRPISFLVWSLQSHRLAVCFEGGLVCVIAMNAGALAGSSALAVGFRLSDQVQQGKVFSAFLREDVLAVATGKNVEIRRFLNDGDPRWDLIKSLPASSTTFTTSSDGNIQSIHSFTQDQILVSYETGIAKLWRFERLDEVSVIYSHEATISFPGVINDVSSAKGAILVAAAGTYQVLLLGSTTAQTILIPRDPITKYPQIVTCAKYVSDDLVIGAGAGQLVLWNADLGNRLQSLPFRDEDFDDAPITHHICTAYRADEDSGWIVTAHDGGQIICWKTIEYMGN